MTVDFGLRDNNGQDDEERRPPIDRSMLLGSLKVEPEVPLFITYFTIYPDKDGRLKMYPDVYGYDRVIYDYFRNFME